MDDMLCEYCQSSLLPVWEGDIEAAIIKAAKAKAEEIKNSAYALGKPQQD